MRDVKRLGALLVVGGALALGVSGCSSTTPGGGGDGGGGGTHWTVTLTLSGPITGTYTYKGDAAECGIAVVKPTLQDGSGKFVSLNINSDNTYVVRGGSFVNGFTGKYSGTFNVPKDLSQPTTVQANFAGTATGEGTTLTVSGSADISCK